MIELSRRECLDLLAGHEVGRLAVAGTGPAPIVRPVNYVFDERAQAVIFQTGAGSKLSALLRETHATFEIDGVDAESRSGWSVIIVGVTEPLLRPDDIRRAEAHKLESWAPGKKSHWVRIRARTVTGRRLAGPGEPAWSRNLSPSAHAAARTGRDPNGL